VGGSNPPDPPSNTALLMLSIHQGPCPYSSVVLEYKVKKLKYIVKSKDKVKDTLLIE